MPKRPEDDWTRPIPRTPRPDGPRTGTSDADATQAIPRQPTRRPSRQPQRPTDDWRDRSREVTQPVTAPQREQQGYRDQRYQGGAYGDPTSPDLTYGEPGTRAYPPQDARRPAGARGATAYPVGQGRRPAAGTPGQPPRGPRGTDRPAPAPRPRRRYGPRRVLATLALLMVGYLLTMLVVAGLVWTSIGRVDSTPDASDRPGAAAGENYLLVGTDSREGLTEEERSDFGTGWSEGSRADTVMLLHVPTVGQPTLVSLPRDSYVEIRDRGWDKLNAAHSIGGPEMLVDTVERNTGLPVSGYLEIGFGGFVSVVEKVGGVRMCLDQPVSDEKAHIDLPAGCQELTGPEALGYVRMRYSDPRGDLGRVERQREFLGALVGRMASPATVLNPWRLYSVGTTTGRALSLGTDTSLVETARIGWAMKQIAADKGVSVTVPVADANYQTASGSSVLWDEAAADQLFTALRNGDPVTVQP